TALTEYELKHDCLCYLSYTGNAVKSARLFAGYEHQQQTKRLADHFDKSPDYYHTLHFDRELVKDFHREQTVAVDKNRAYAFEQCESDDFTAYEQAYHHLIYDLVQPKYSSTKVILNQNEKIKIFVDGGISKNPIHMQLLTEVFEETKVFAATVAQATALGA